MWGPEVTELPAQGGQGPEGLTDPPSVCFLSCLCPGLCPGRPPRPQARALPAGPPPAPCSSAPWVRAPRRLPHRGEPPSTWLGLRLRLCPGAPLRRLSGGVPLSAGTTPTPRLTPNTMPESVWPSPGSLCVHGPSRPEPEPVLSSMCDPKLLTLKPVRPGRAPPRQLPSGWSDNPACTPSAASPNVCSKPPPRGWCPQKLWPRVPASGRCPELQCSPVCTAQAGPQAVAEPPGSARRPPPGAAACASPQDAPREPLSAGPAATVGHVHIHPPLLRPPPQAFLQPPLPRARRPRLGRRSRLGGDGRWPAPSLPLPQQVLAGASRGRAPLAGSPGLGWPCSAFRAMACSRRPRFPRVITSYISDASVTADFWERESSSRPSSERTSTSTENAGLGLGGARGAGARGPASSQLMSGAASPSSSSSSSPAPSS